jgi:hypothetical protein
LVSCLTQLLQVLSFLLVVKMMLPITQSDRQKRSEFQRFIFNGFANREELETAIFVNNPDMTEEQRADVKRDLNQLAKLIENSSSDSSIVSGMVQVVEVNDYAYIGKWRFGMDRLLG